MQSDQFLLTQEFLAMMLGVQRTGVSAAAGALQRAGLICYNWGIITIRPPRPEAAARASATAFPSGRSIAYSASPSAATPDRVRFAPAMLDAVLLPLGRHHALRRFWKSARGFWHGSTAGLAWGLIALLITVTVLQVLVQYWLNLWNRDFFNAFEFRNGCASGLP
jgi:hypothetical protein